MPYDSSSARRRATPEGYEFSCPDERMDWPYFTDESAGGRYWFSVFHREDYRPRDGQIAFRDEAPGTRYEMNTRRNPEGKPVFLGATRLS